MTARWGTRYGADVDIHAGVWTEAGDLDTVPRMKNPTLAVLAVCTLLVGCHVGPQPGNRAGFDRQAADMIPRLEAMDPTIESLFASSYAQAVFPVVGEGGLVIGNGWGQGAVFVGGRVVGYASVGEHSIGGVVGGEKFSIVVFFETPAALENFKTAGLKWDTNANAVAGDAGVSTIGKYDQGVAVVEVDQAGLMANASIGIANFSYESVEEWMEKNQSAD